jgi:hypothetical protein
MTIVPFDWTMDYQGDGGIPLYAFHKPNAVLMLSLWLPPCAPEEIPTILDSMAKGFLENIKEVDAVNLKFDDYTKGDFKGDSFSGHYIAFTLSIGIIQTMFMMSDGNEIWSGQYSGSTDQWPEALKILQSLRHE